MSAESTFRSDGFCELDQYKLYYELHGDERREKIMLIAGAFCTRRIFDGLVARLAQDFQASVCTAFPLKWVYTPTSTLAVVQALQERLLQHVWPTGAVHVLGASLGGMAAQKLALLLLPQQRIKSLILAVTAVKTPISIHAPMWLWELYAKVAFGGPPRKIVPRFLKMLLTPEEAASRVDTAGGPGVTLREHLMKEMVQNYDDYFCCHNPTTCAAHMHMIFRHKLKSAEISTLVNSRLPILVVIGSQDKLMRPRHQRKAARALQARSMEVKSAHWLASQTVPIADAVVSVAYSPPLGPEKDPKSVDKLGSPDLRPGE